MFGGVCMDADSSRLCMKKIILESVCANTSLGEGIFKA